ncbi:MAG: glycerol-3-phosphate dehydrogenase, partial [Rhizobacter sp.]
AQHTSSASTKLIHGGLRYLEYREFALVRKALAEREVLLKSAPHIMRPLRFVMPHDPGMRPFWLIRLGLFLYDHLARREVLPGSRTVDLRRHVAGAALKPGFRRGFVYSDGWVDDARLVTLCAMDAAARGAEVLTGCACVDARRRAGHWDVTLRHEDGRERQVRSRLVVNATGPWAAQFLTERTHLAGRRPLRLVKGSHIVVTKRFLHDHAYIFQNADQRIIFAIPYEGDFTLIGTTELEQDGPIGEARIEPAEIDYLCAQASRYFAAPVLPADVVWTYSGVRPLLDDEAGNPAAVTRDYRLELDQEVAPLLSVWGGKLTTFRKLAEEAADRIEAALANGRMQRRGAWTEGAHLPGGDIVSWLGAAAGPAADVEGNFSRFAEALQRRHADVSPRLVHRLARAYGTRADALLASCLGAEIAPGVHAAELRHLVAHEWAVTAEDVLWRRSKLGLHLDVAGQEAVDRWMKAAIRAEAAPEPTTASPDRAARGR